MDTAGKAILVTGGAGFMGSHLCERLLSRGNSILCLDNLQTGRRENVAHLEDNAAFEFVEHDVVDDLPDWLHGAGLDQIYHLACPASPPQYQLDPERTMLTNVLGTRNCLRLAERTGARLLLTSTSEVYGDPERHPQAEDYRGSVSCTGPRACYDEGKRAAEALACDFHRLGRAGVRIARCFNTYGPRMLPDDGRVVSNVVCQALLGEAITIYGDGQQTRSFCFVDDMVEGLIRLMNNERAGASPMNLGNPAEMTVIDLARMIVLMTGSRSTIVYRDLPVDDPSRRRPDIRRAIETLDWRPAVELEDGLRATIAWFERRNKLGPAQPCDSQAWIAAADPAATAPV